MALLVDTPEESGDLADVGTAGENGADPTYIEVAATPVVAGSNYNLHLHALATGAAPLQVYRYWEWETAYNEFWYTGYWRQAVDVSIDAQTAWTLRFEDNIPAHNFSLGSILGGNWNYTLPGGGTGNLTGSYSLDTWYRLKIYMKCGTSAGIVRVWVDGALIIDWSGAFGTDAAGIYRAIIGASVGNYDYPGQFYHDAFKMYSSPGPSSANLTFKLVIADLLGLLAGGAALGSLGQLQARYVKGRLAQAMLAYRIERCKLAGIRPPLGPTALGTPRLRVRVA